MGEKNRKIDSEFITFVKKELDYDKKSSESLKKAKKKVVALCKVLDEDPMPDIERQAIVKLFAKLSMGIPLTPLTGKDDEWEEVDISDTEVTDGTIKWQNKRCPRVYKRADGTAFDSRAKVFSYEGMVWFRNEKSNVEITEWPYTVNPSMRIMLKKEKENDSERYS